MMRNRQLMSKRTTCLLMLLCSLTFVSVAIAGKPTKPGDGGGGGTTPVPTGTIYFEQKDNHDNVLGRRMKGDGSEKADSARIEPSFIVHGTSRWFLTTLATADFDADGSLHGELFATNEQGDTVQLTDDLNVEPVERVCRWAKDDSFLSYVAIIDGPDGKSAALFTAEVSWLNKLPIVGVPEKVLEVNLYDDYYPGVWFFDWSPMGDELIYTTDDQQGGYLLFVKKFFADGSSETRGLGFGAYPEWSPNGERIAFQSSDGAIWTMRPDGMDALKVSNPKVNSFQYHFQPNWSPDSQFLAFTQVTPLTGKGGGSSTQTYDILRISASGGSAKNLTADTDLVSATIGWRQ